jgi:hypothetical protein
MKEKRLWLLSLCFVLILTMGSYRIWADNDKNTFVIDVACDARTYRQNNVDPSATGSNRGDTFIVQGKIYPGGTIPKGNGVFSPDNPGSIGTWICRGVWMVSSSELAAGASPAFDTSQIYLLPNQSKQLFSEGLEGPSPTLRAVPGGTGSFAGFRGQVRQELLGTNSTGLFNIRFTFHLQHSDQEQER